MARRIKGKVIARLPMELVQFLRHNSSGAHSTPKGKKGYNRNAEKVKVRREIYV